MVTEQLVVWARSYMKKFNRVDKNCVQTLSFTPSTLTYTSTFSEKFFKEESKKVWSMKNFVQERYYDAVSVIKTSSHSNFWNLDYNIDGLVVLTLTLSDETLHIHFENGIMEKDFTLELTSSGKEIVSEITQ